jgi:hypothetical protein
MIAETIPDHAINAPSHFILPKPLEGSLEKDSPTCGLKIIRAAPIQ